MSSGNFPLFRTGVPVPATVPSPGPPAWRDRSGSCWRPAPDVRACCSGSSPAISPAAVEDGPAAAETPSPSPSTPPCDDPACPLVLPSVPGGGRARLGKDETAGAGPDAGSAASPEISPGDAEADSPLSASAASRPPAGFSESVSLPDSDSAACSAGSLMSVSRLSSLASSHSSYRLRERVSARSMRRIFSASVSPASSAKSMGERPHSLGADCAQTGSGSTRGTPTNNKQPIRTRFFTRILPCGPMLQCYCGRPCNLNTSAGDSLLKTEIVVFFRPSPSN